MNTRKCIETWNNFFDLFSHTRDIAKIANGNVMKWKRKKKERRTVKNGLNVWNSQNTSLCSVADAFLRMKFYP